MRKKAEFSVAAAGTGGPGEQGTLARRTRRLMPGHLFAPFSNRLLNRRVRIVEQIFRLIKAKNRRNTLCIAKFFDKIRRQICRQDVRGDLIIGYFRGGKTGELAAAAGG